MSLLAGWVSRIVIVLALSLGVAVAQSQSPEEELVSLRQQLESAAQSGDAKAVLRLSAKIEALEARIVAQAERAAAQAAAQAENEKFSSDVQTLLKAYRRQMADAAAAGDTARVTKLAEAITRLEASAPVTPEMLEGTWVLDRVLQNGVQSSNEDTNESILIFEEDQRFRHETPLILSDGYDWEGRVCRRGLEFGEKWDLSNSTQEPPVAVVAGRYETDGRQVYLTDRWGQYDIHEQKDRGSRTWTLRENGTLSISFKRRYPYSGTCELVFRKTDVPQHFEGDRIDARQLRARPGHGGDLCGWRGEDTGRLILYALEHELTNDSPYWRTEYNFPFYTLVGLAVRHDCTPELVERLLQTGLDPNYCHGGRVGCRSQAGPSSLIHLSPLLDKAAEVNRSVSPRRSEIERYRTVRILLDHGADPNGQRIRLSSDGQNVIDKLPILTQAVYRVKSGHEDFFDIVELLLAYGADPKRKTSNGYNAFKYAESFGLGGNQRRQLKSLLSKANALRKARLAGKWKPKY